MARKTLQTQPDDDHVQFGESESYNTTGLPADFGNGMSDFDFNPQYFGRIMANPDNSGFGAAYIEPEEPEDE